MNSLAPRSWLEVIKFLAIKMMAWWHEKGQEGCDGIELNYFNFL